MQERARLAGGNAVLHSAPGMGTRMGAWIPYESTSRSTDLPQSEQKPNVPTEKPSPAEVIRVMVVDDHEVVRRGLSAILESAEVTTLVGEAEDGEEAVEKIAALNPNVVPRDIQMPKVKGADALKRIRELNLDARSILLSTYAKDEHIFEGLRAGARGYLVKEAGREELLNAIRTVFRGGSLLQSVIADRLIERLEKGGSSGLTVPYDSQLSLS